jgi:hypothetical protein
MTRLTTLKPRVPTFSATNNRRQRSNMPDDDTPNDPHDAERILAAIEVLGERMARIETQLAAQRTAEEVDAVRLAELLPLIEPVVGEKGFIVESVYAFEQEAGARAEPLRRALDGMSPKACGRLSARASKGLRIVRAGYASDCATWRIVGGFEERKPQSTERERLGNW